MSGVVATVPPHSGSILSADELLDAIPDATCVLDSAGTIVAVNTAWRMFAADNGGSTATTGVGVNYLDVCDRAATAGSEDAATVVDSLRWVLAGATVEAVVDYPCPSPEVGRWFALRITPICGSAPGVLITHTNITRQKMAEADLERQASRDPLTGLANRNRLNDCLQRALEPERRRTASVGVVYLDLDGFKPVNDTYGHSAGDEVLQTVATRLSGAVRDGDVVARIGGDEFAVVAADINAEQLSALCRRIERVLAQPFTVHGRLVPVGASVGGCLAGPDESPTELLERADTAMYAMKRRRKSGA